jgi:hypothetical protein
MAAVANGSGRSALPRNAPVVSGGRMPGVKRPGQATIGEVVCRQSFSGIGMPAAGAGRPAVLDVQAPSRTEGASGRTRGDPGHC